MKQKKLKTSNAFKKAEFFLLFLILILFSLSCNQTQKVPVLIEKKEGINIEHLKKNSLSKNIFLLAPAFNSIDCESFGECDCCASNYIFLDNNNFICIDYCLEVDAYYSGKYKIDNEIVELKYNSTVVKKEYNWESETDTTNIQPEYFYKIEKCKPFKSTWIKLNCKEKVCFKTAEKETQYASFDKTKNFKSFMSKLKKEGILQKLNNK